MARAQHLALTLTTLLTTLLTTAGARYGGSDYAVRMPAYGDDEPSPPERDDYHAHSPDAPISLDYNIKYEEDFKDKTEQSIGVEVNEANTWQRTIRKQKKRADDVFRLDDLDKFETEDEIPKSKSVNRFTKHRPRHKNRKFEDDIEDRPRFLKRPIRDRSDDIQELGGDEEQPDKKLFLDENLSLQNEKFRLPYRTSSVRPRRRPRDRYERPKASEDDDPEIGESGPDRNPDRISDRNPDRNPDRNQDTWSLDKEKEFIDRHLADDEDLPHPRAKATLRRIAPDSGEEEDPLVRHPLKNKGKGRHEYDNYDYYDMKRAMNIKNKLPAARRTEDPVGTLLVPLPLPRSYATVFLANRRLLPDTTRRITLTPRKTTAETEASTIVSVQPTRVSLTPPVTSTTTVAANISKELSIAEKSRLSILKKAQRKESGASGQVTKPPVLLQVSQRLQTVLMVEPPSSEGPWMRAAEVQEDSPQRLKKVRRLMRQKLLSNARNIQDLTDNWDELVCDYVDMSLLQNTAHSNNPEDHHLALFLLFMASFREVL